MDWQQVTALVIVALAATLCSLVASLVLTYSLHQVRRRYARLLAGGARREDLLSAVNRHLAAVERLQGRTDLLGREVAALRQRVSTLVQTVGFTRYDAFDDIGGWLSYSAAFLNEAGDGVVLTGINTRSETRSYAKPVEGGRSSHNLSEEEQAAIALAMGRPASVARSGA